MGTIKVYINENMRTEYSYSTKHQLRQRVKLILFNLYPLVSKGRKINIIINSL